MSASRTRTISKAIGIPGAVISAFVAIISLLAFALRDAAPWSVMTNDAGEWSYTDEAGTRRKYERHRSYYEALDEMLAEKRAKAKKWRVDPGPTPAPKGSKAIAAAPTATPSSSFYFTNSSSVNTSVVAPSGSVVKSIPTTSYFYTAAAPTPAPAPRPPKQVSFAGDDGTWIIAETLHPERDDLYAHENVKMKSRFEPRVKRTKDSWEITFAK